MRINRRSPAVAIACLVLSLTLSDFAGTQGVRHTASMAALQSAVDRAMSGKSGSLVVIGVATGKVLAAYHLGAAAHRVALPGSSIKTFTLMTLLENGKIDDHTTMMCRRSLTVGDHQLNCTHPDVKQPFDPATALAYSCNTYFAKMATRLSPSELRDSFLRFGFASPSALAPNEVTGSVPLATTESELQLQAIGEGGIHVTPLELLRAYQSVARLSQKHDPKLAPVFAGLEGSVAYGMGRLAQPGATMKVAGKTGTSLVEEGSWRHGWFAGYAPADKPEIALVVFLENGHGPTDAASIAREVFGTYAANRRVSASRGAGQ
jgi:cell division protein FtsI/penicillin-binding protein 2